MRIEFPAYGQCFSFRWNSTSPGKLIVQANQTYRVYPFSIIIDKNVTFFVFHSDR